MEKKQEPEYGADLCDPDPAIRAAALICDGRIQYLTEEELRAITQLFDLPPDWDSVLRIDSLLNRLCSLTDATNATVESWEEDDLDFIQFTPSKKCEVADA
jgi:hypothetical protein